MRKGKLFEGDIKLLEHFHNAILDDGRKVCEACLFERITSAVRNPSLVSNGEYDNVAVVLNKPLKGDMNYYYDADTDIQRSQALLEVEKILVETLEEIMSTIRWRHQNIGNIIKWRSFEAGV